MSAAPRIAIAAGGTAGHVVPALAVADALRAEGATVAFIGGDRAEAQLIPAAGYELHRLDVEGLSRSNPSLALRAAVKAGAAVPKSRGILRRLGADAVMGGGGYVAGPAGLAALSMRLPLVLTEADSHLGLTNRALAPFARRVCLAFPLHGREGDRYRVTGRPIPPVQGDRASGRAHFGLAEGETCVLVFGGSLGSRSINNAAIEAFAEAPFAVLHVTGRRDHPALAVRDMRAGYRLLSYLDSAEFGLALAASDLVVARSGGSVFELAAHGRPAILVPYPHAAGDHQSANARWMAEGGAAVVIADSELSAARLGGEVAELLVDPHRLRSMAAASLALARPRAAQDVAAEVLAAACPESGSEDGSPGRAGAGAAGS